MIQTIYLPTILIHPNDFFLFHRVIVPGLRHLSPPERIRIVDVQEYMDNEFIETCNSFIADWIDDPEYNNYNCEYKDYQERTSFFKYKIVLESSEDQLFKELPFLEQGLSNLFEEVFSPHVGFFFYLIDKGRKFHVLNLGNLKSQGGFFNDTDDPETQTQFAPLQKKAEYFKRKWYGV